jgi:hypothetical protein
MKSVETSTLHVSRWEECHSCYALKSRFSVPKIDPRKHKHNRKLAASDVIGARFSQTTEVLIGFTTIHRDYRTRNIE